MLKPSERTPLTALALEKLLADEGLPAAAAQVVCGEPGAILDEFLAHDAVEVISFTGGVAVGKSIADRLGYRRAVLELGGNDPMLVLGDADLDDAARLAVDGAFRNLGQRCTAVKRIIAVADVADELAERIVTRTGRLRCGDPLDEDTDVGTVIDEQAARVIEARIVGGRAGRARDVRPGRADHPRVRPGRGDRHRQRHPLRPLELGVHVRLARSRVAFASSGRAP